MHGLGGHGGTQSTYGGCCPAVQDLIDWAYQCHYPSLPLSRMGGRTEAAFEGGKWVENHNSLNMQCAKKPFASKMGPNCMYEVIHGPLWFHRRGIEALN